MLKWRILFIFLLILIIAATVFWIKLDRGISGTDSVNHLLFQLNFFEDFKEIIDSSLTVPQKLIRGKFLLSTPTFGSTLYWPNFVYFVTSIFNLILGRSLFVSRLTILPYILILFFSTYLISKKLSNEKVAFFSAVFLSLYPLIFESMRQYHLDFPLTAFVCFIIYLLMQSEYFKKFSYAVLLGLVAGIGMNIKGQGLLFISWPIVGVIFCIIFKVIKKEISIFELKKIGLNFFVFLILFITISMIWWGGKERLIFVLRSLRLHIFSELKFRENYPEILEYSKFSLPVIFSYLFDLFRNSMGAIPFMFLVVALISLFKYKYKLKDSMILVNWIIPPFVLFSIFFSIKHPRFLMPILPALAIISSIGILRINKTFLRCTLIALFLLVGIFNFYYVTFIGKSLHIGRWDFSLFTTLYNDNDPLVKENFLEGLKKPLSFLELKEGSLVGIVNLGQAPSFENLYKLKLLFPEYLYVDILEMPGIFCNRFKDMPFVMVFSQNEKDNFKDNLSKRLKIIHQQRWHYAIEPFGNFVKQIEQFDKYLSQNFMIVKKTKLLTGEWVFFLKSKIYKSNG